MLQGTSGHINIIYTDIIHIHTHIYIYSAIYTPTHLVQVFQAVDCSGQHPEQRPQTSDSKSVYIYMCRVKYGVYTIRIICICKLE